jgi:D-alanyl-D-alanine carboxypeptidase (penicillin-binding protein 5/6)
MIQPVLQPVQRRRRRRRILWPRVVALGLVTALAAAAGVYYGMRGGSSEPRAAAAKQAPGHASIRVVLHRQAPLVYGTPLLAAHAFTPALDARAAILVDARSGRVLWTLHPHARRRIASTTKIMTALLALKKLAPHDLVTVDPEAPRVPLVREGLRAHERVQAWKLFYGLLLYSGNDDALALAVAASGSKLAFIHDMNVEADRLGLRDTHFNSTSGVIDDGNYSSAWDLAALTRAAMRNARFDAIVRTRVKRVPWAAPTYSKIYVNKNRLIGTYRGATGVKTGYTTKSGPCIVASARRGRVSLIAVVLDSPSEYGDAKRLLNLGFRELS